jgi:glucan phosphoethanolaminetransferase (alkaline phosphatase superfamily)
MHKIVIACELVKNVVVLAAFALEFSNSRNFNEYFENLGRKISLIVFTYIWFISIAYIDFTKKRLFLWSSETFYNILAILGIASLLFIAVYFVIKNVKKASATLILWAMFIAYLSSSYFRIITNWNLLLNHLTFTFVPICTILGLYFVLVLQAGIFYEHRFYLVHKLNELIELKAIQLILVIFTSFCMPYFYFYPSNERKTQFCLLAIGSYFLFSISVDLLIRKVIKSKLSLENWAQKHDGRAYHDSVRLGHARVYFDDNYLIVMSINNLLFIINK